jgi:UTP:GlnB (protein PII) uridylyltransferase
VNQADLIDRVTNVLSGLPRAGSAFLGGSFGRGEADDFSDVDVYVVVAGPEDIPPMLTELPTIWRRCIRSRFRTCLNARTINSVTGMVAPDFTVLTQHEIGYLAGSAQTVVRPAGRIRKDARHFRAPL